MAWICTCAVTLRFTQSPSDTFHFVCATWERCNVIQEMHFGYLVFGRYFKGDSLSSAGADSLRLESCVGVTVEGVDGSAALASRDGS